MAQARVRSAESMYRHAEKLAAMPVPTFIIAIAQNTPSIVDGWRDGLRENLEPYRSAACEALKRVAAKTDLSNDVREVVDRALAD